MSSSIYSPDFEEKLHYIELAKKCYNENNIDQASLLLQSIGDNHPPYLSVYFLKSQCAFSLGQNDKALKSVNEGFKVLESDEETTFDGLLMKIKLLLLRSRIYQALKKNESGQKDLEEAKRIIENELSKRRGHEEQIKNIENELNEIINKTKEGNSLKVFAKFMN